jgi:hypothetical protein
MALEVPEFIKAILEDFDRKLVPLAETEVLDALARQTPPSQASPEHVKGYTAEFVAFQFRPLPSGDSVWGTYFGPMFSAEHEGKAVYGPDVAEIDEETVGYWQRRSAEVQHPVLAARYFRSRLGPNPCDNRRGS